MCCRRGLAMLDPWGGEVRMLSEEIDFHEVFRVNPTAMALLTGDFDFVDANDEFLATIGHSLEDLLGRNVFEFLPKVTKEPGGDPKWTVLEAALTTRHREVYQLSRYDIEDPAHPGVFAERYWSAAVTPVLGVGGEVDVLEWSARDVTPIINRFRSLEAERAPANP